ncbi:MAG: ribonuclease HII [Gemmobacter sp.]|uniref:ribonuclease HII n=1 Tax=Gemmobacter sp. TaxID=1898957 RepID=UPI001A376B29|nr:ribonuclease HII [Gemmobacter sp.]MBL8563168.1 ribonuclease HII [Gemmobacter sp.]
MAPQTPKPVADFSLETEARLAGLWPVAGVDEVGRGPLCGPVTAAAVILDPANIPQGIGDSKTLSAAKREMLAGAIMASARWSVAHASVAEIDRLNILNASHLAMERAVAGLGLAPGFVPGFVLVDGNRLPRSLPGPAAAVVKGDAKSLSIAAASILAKVVRDHLMVDLAQQHPGYGWERNAGYPTQDHLAALLNLGVTPQHRRSFKPVHNILYQEHSISR